MENQQLNWIELLKELGLYENEIKVTLIKRVRHDDSFQEGRVTGFKSGLRGGGHHDYHHGVPHSFSSDRIRQLKPPMIQITYNCFSFTKGKQYSDWVPVDNCIFEFTKEKI